MTSKSNLSAAALMFWRYGVASPYAHILNSKTNKYFGPPRDGNFVKSYHLRFFTKVMRYFCYAIRAAGIEAFFAEGKFNKPPANLLDRFQRQSHLSTFQNYVYLTTDLWRDTV